MKPRWKLPEIPANEGQIDIPDLPAAAHPQTRTSASTVSVMFTKPRRPGTSNQSCSVSDFICYAVTVRGGCGKQFEEWIS
jgi:hypothetical protein